MSVEFKIRAATSSILLVSWILTVLSGIVLLLKSSVALYRYVPIPTSIVVDIHTYAGFVMFGSSIIHVYLNRKAIANYIKKLVELT